MTRDPIIRPVADHVRLAARQRPGALAVLDPAGPIAYRMLVDDVDALATELLEQGLTRADMVGLHLGFSYLHLLMILALDRLSIPSMAFPTVGSDPPPPRIEPYHDVTVLISGTVVPADPPCRWITVADHRRPKLGTADAARLATLDSPPDSLLRIMWSSGTTGGPKGTPMTRAVLARRLILRRLLHGVGPHTRAFAGMSLATPPGYLMPLATLASGGAVILPHPTTDFINLANLVGVTTTSGQPTMLATLIGKGRLETMACFEVAGANLPAKLALEARRTLTPNLWIDYGTSETGRIAGADAAIADNNVAGYVIPWITAEIVDAADRPLPPGQEGRLRVRGAQIITGYYKNEAATRRNFRDGWFYPGDVGILTAERLLRITGRVEDLIVHDGISLSPGPLEDAMRELAGVRDVAVFPVLRADHAPEIGAAFVLEPGVDAQAVRAAAAARLGSRAPSRIILVDRLPRNENGKVLRRDLVALALRDVRD